MKEKPTKTYIELHKLSARASKAMYQYEAATDSCGERNWEIFVKKMIVILNRMERLK